jgi:hypothetical protein
LIDGTQAEGGEDIVAVRHPNIYHQIIFFFLSSFYINSNNKMYLSAFAQPGPSLSSGGLSYYYYQPPNQPATLDNQSLTKVKCLPQWAYPIHLAQLCKACYYV